MKQRFGVTLLALIMMLMLWPAVALGAETDSVVDAAEINYFEAPEIDPRVPAAGTLDNSRDNPNAVRPADEAAVLCIDRVKLPQFAIDFYETLERESKPAGASGLGRDGFLIDPSEAPSTFQFSDGANYVVPVAYPSEAELIRGGFQFEDAAEFAENCVIAAYYAFTWDHPEVFWLRNGVGVYTDGNARVCYFSLAKVGFPEWAWEIRSEDYRDPSAIKNGISALDASVSSIVSAAAGKSSNYEKIAYFNEWLTVNNQYNYIVAYTNGDTAHRVHEAISALTTADDRPGGGRSGNDGPVCDGYSKAFQLLCQRAGIPCVLVSQPGHAWNYVQADPSDSRWYAMDVTWNDPVLSGSPSLSEYLSWGGRESTAYSLVGADTIVYDGESDTFGDQHSMVNQEGTPSYVLADFRMGPELSRLAYVDSVSITDLDAPAEEARPDTSVTLSAEPKDAHDPSQAGSRDLFTNPSVTWSPALTNGTFAANTVYTATISFAPRRQGYGLTAADASKIAVAGAESVSVTADGAIRAVFPKTGGIGGELSRPEAGDFTYSLPTGLVYDGSSKTAAVRRTIASATHSGHFTLAFTDERDNPVSDLVKPGTYRVFAQVSAHDGYDAAEVSLGSVTIREASGRHGKVSIAPADAPKDRDTVYVAADTEIIIHVSPDPGYELTRLEVIRSDNGQTVPVSGGGSVYTFKVPASDASIQATFSIP